VLQCKFKWNKLFVGIEFSLNVKFYIYKADKCQRARRNVRKTKKSERQS